MNRGIPELVIIAGTVLLCLMVIAAVIMLGLWVVRTRAGGGSGEDS